MSGWEADNASLNKTIANLGRTKEPNSVDIPERHAEQGDY